MTQTRSVSMQDISDEILLELSSASMSARVQLQAALPPHADLPRDDLPDLSPQGHARVADAVRRSAERLGQAGDDPITAAVLGRFLELGEPGGLPGLHGLGYEPYFHDAFGYGKPVLDYDALLGSMPIDNSADVDGYLERLDGAVHYVQGILLGLDQRAELGLTSTAESIERTVAQLTGIITTDPNESALVRDFADKLAVAGFNASGPVARAEELVRTRVHPAWAMLAERGRVDLPHARAALGLCALPGGDQAYAYAVRASTTTDLTPEGIHEIGQEEVERLHDVIRSKFHALGFSGSDVGDLYRQLSARGDQKYPAGDRQAVVDDVRAALADLAAAIRPHFTNWPRTQCPVEVIDPALEPVMPSHVRPPHLDGEPFTFGLNVGDALAGTRSETKVLAAHEAIPGHALQMALAGERSDIPRIRRALSFNAYNEGWAKYAETLPVELGIWDDPYLELARLRYELYSTTNLVVDTGCNLLGWDARRVAEYCSWSTGDDATLPRMIPLRCIHTPGQLLGYKIGMIEFERARKAAQEAWGAEFTLPRFHDAVINHGSVPLNMLVNLALGGVA